MNLLEIATGLKSSEYRVVMIIVAVLACNVLGLDVMVVLPLFLDGSDIVKYEELIKSLGGVRTTPSDAAIWALLAVGVSYPASRLGVKWLKTKLAGVVWKE